MATHCAFIIAKLCKADAAAAMGSRLLQWAATLASNGSIKMQWVIKLTGALIHEHFRITW